MRETFAASLATKVGLPIPLLIAIIEALSQVVIECIKEKETPAARMRWELTMHPWLSKIRFRRTCGGQGMDREKADEVYPTFVEQTLATDDMTLNAVMGASS